MQLVQPTTGRRPHRLQANTNFKNPHLARALYEAPQPSKAKERALYEAHQPSKAKHGRLRGFFWRQLTKGKAVHNSGAACFQGSVQAL